jgi:hypothetical protein
VSAMRKFLIRHLTRAFHLLCRHMPMYSVCLSVHGWDGFSSVGSPLSATVTDMGATRSAANGATAVATMTGTAKGAGRSPLRPRLLAVLTPLPCLTGSPHCGLARSSCYSRETRERENRESREREGREREREGRDRSAGLSAPPLSRRPCLSRYSPSRPVSALSVRLYVCMNPAFS